MDRSHIIASAALAMLVCGAAGAAPATDAEIQKCITDKLGAAPKLSAQGFSATVQNGTATLTGNAQNPGSKGAASGIAKRCNAKTVSNEIVIDKSAAKAVKSAKAKPASEAAEASAEQPAVETATKSGAASAATDKLKETASSKVKEAAASKAKSAIAP